MFTRARFWFSMFATAFNVWAAVSSDHPAMFWANATITAFCTIDAIVCGAKDR